ncbi:hypothetical protein BDBG_18046, partial [Blastomyces gilchristii SLH14081]
ALAWETKTCGFETCRGYIKSGTQVPQVSNKYRGVQITSMNHSMFLSWKVIIAFTELLNLISISTILYKSSKNTRLITLYKIWLKALSSAC